MVRVLLCMTLALGAWPFGPREEQQWQVLPGYLGGKGKLGLRQ